MLTDPGRHLVLRHSDFFQQRSNAALVEGQAPRQHDVEAHACNSMCLDKLRGAAHRSSWVCQGFNEVLRQQAIGPKRQRKDD